MGYHGPYTLTQRCISEFIATWMFIFLLESVLANKLLPKTKGHEMGFGWVALGVGLACFLPVQYFGYISSMVNPAMALANCIAESIDWDDLVPITICQVLGAICGGMTVWIYYLPHFTTVPEPPPSKKADELLRTRDFIGSSALVFASYSSENRPGTDIVSMGWKKLKDVWRGEWHTPRAYREEDILGKESTVGRHGKQRRHSVNVSDLHQRLQRYHQDEENQHHQSQESNLTPTEIIDEPLTDNTSHLEKPLASYSLPMDAHVDVRAPLLVHNSDPGEKTGPVDDDHYTKILESGEKVKHHHHHHHGVKGSTLRALAHHDHASNLYYEPDSDGDSDEKGHTFEGKGGTKMDQFHAQQATLDVKTGCADPAGEKRVNVEENKTPEKTKTQRLHEAAVKADQNAKLAVFATRPAVFAPLYNLLNEIIGTLLLTSGILMLNQRGAMIWEAESSVYFHGLKSFWVGILVVVLVLCLGGPGVALNPARDLGPRIAHWILPIRGKGHSEWYYGWIPVLGPMIGGALGGVFYNLCDKLNKSAVHGGYYDPMFADCAELSEL